jgi:predicted ATPase/Tfp pilus assembly protein PilF
VSYPSADDPQLLQDLKAALRRWHKATLADTTLAFNLGSVQYYLMANPNLPRAAALQRVMQTALSRLRDSEQTHYADLLERRYILDQGVHRLCEILHCSERTLYYWLAEARAALARALWTLEQEGAKSVLDYHNLPAQPTPFIGREDELTRVITLLDNPQCRLLTIVGPGGIDKTRLALQAAGLKTKAFCDGVFWVPLASMSSAEFLVSTIAKALRFSFFGSQAPQAQLLNYLREKKVLLILDNFEHLVEDVALWVEILQQAPQVKLLITSRERVNLQWEWCFEIRGLEYPEKTRDNQDLEGYSAVQLFQQIARRTCQYFSLSKHKSAVVRICQLVEGMPLGIELAAAWLKTHTCEEIAQEIQNNVDFLATSSRDVPERHRSLQAVFEHSWGLLTPSERHTFMKLSVLNGFQKEAAIAVTDATPDILKSLVDKSLLRFMPSGRYKIHELLRQCAAQKLAAEPTVQAETHNRHCGYYVTFLQHQGASLTREEASEALAAIRSEIENVRAAWHWAITQVKIKEIGQSLDALSQFYLLIGPFQEGERIIGKAVNCIRALINQADRPGRDERILLGKLLIEQARFMYLGGMFDQAIVTVKKAIDLTPWVASLQAKGYLVWGQALLCQASYEAAWIRLEKALALSETIRSRQTEADTLRNLGNISLLRDDYAGARVYYEQSLYICREIGDRRGESGALNNLGIIARQQRNYDGARAYYEQALCIKRQIGDRWGQGATLNGLGLTFADQGDYARAKTRLGQALRIYQRIGGRQEAGNTLNDLGNVSIRLGDYAAARTYLEQALLIFREIQDRRGESSALSDLGLLSHHLGDNQVAREYCYQALLIAQTLSVRSNQGYTLTYLGHVLAHLGLMSEATAIYQQALNLWRELDRPNLAMEPLAGLARVFLAQEKTGKVQALACVEEILSYLKSHSLAGVFEPFQVYLTCYRVLHTNGDPRAPGILDTAYRLLGKHAAKISDEKSRRLFLENVTVHREIVEEAANASSLRPRGVSGE